MQKQTQKQTTRTTKRVQQVKPGLSAVWNQTSTFMQYPIGPVCPQYPNVYLKNYQGDTHLIQCEVYKRPPAPHGINHFMLEEDCNNQTAM